MTPAQRGEMMRKLNEGSAAESIGNAPPNVVEAGAGAPIQSLKDRIASSKATKEIAEAEKRESLKAKLGQESPPEKDTATPQESSAAGKVATERRSCVSAP